jgi:hypothetical protein
VLIDSPIVSSLAGDVAPGELLVGTQFLGELKDPLADDVPHDL